MMAFSKLVKNLNKQKYDKRVAIKMLKIKQKNAKKKYEFETRDKIWF